MSERERNGGTPGQLRDALVTIRELRAQLAAAQRERAEPIAVVGLGCRFPGGADGPEAFWRLLVEGVDAVGEVPRERWDAGALYDADADAPGAVATRFGAFLDGLDLFDASFFGVSPREAARMDPQQRLLLEVAFHALEDAGLPLPGEEGSPTGVFLGLHSHSGDYALLQLARPEAIDVYTGTGTALGVAANRLSYFFGFRGPSIVVDTACSSSLVAVHLACRSLRSGECDAALAGGANVMLTPESTIAVSRMRMLAADGRCKTFDARADGFVRGEGVGLVVLKRLADALRDGDRVRAVIRGSAVNQDGRTNGLTAPSGLAQREVVRRALEEAGASPAQVGYVETHGTGTDLGDPIEVEALVDVLGDRSPENPCLLGAVKTNIGHLEGAAGIAGLIKAVLALEHELVPPNLHLRELSPHISFGEAPFVVPTEAFPWASSERERVAGVSSFGWGGTNAHVVLAEAPPAPSAATAPAGGAQLLPLSARDPEALRELAGAYRELLERTGEPLAEICATAALRRSHHEHRLTVAGRTLEQLAGRLELHLAGERAAGVACGRAAEESPRIVFVFPGHGPRMAGMGPRLLAEEPVFRAAVERCDEIHRRHAGWSIAAELAAETDPSRPERPELAQPLLLALQVGLAALWRSWGVVPDAIVGASAGEIAAAHVAGALTLEDALSLARHRGRVLERAAGGGRMAAIGMTAEEAERLVAGEEDVAVAVLNGPASTVISGEPAAVERLVEALVARGAFARLLGVDYASHSPAMDGPSAELEEALAGLAAVPPATTIVSTVTGQPVRGPELDARYWGRNLRQPVRLAQAIDRLAAAGPSCFLELGPHPSLAGAISECLDARGERGIVLASLRRGDDERESMLAALGALHVEGVAVDWRAIYGQRRPVALPRYPFQRQRYWLEDEARLERTHAVPAPTEPWRDWLYELAWERRDARRGPAPAPGPFLLLADRGGLAERLAALLRKRGEDVRVLPPGAGGLEAAPEERLGTVLHLRSLDTELPADGDGAPLEAACRSLLGELPGLVRALARAAPPPRLVVVTRGAQPVGEDADAAPGDPLRAAVWGFGRGITLEHPELGCTFVDLPADPGEAEPETILRELEGLDDDDQVALRAGGRFVPRLRPAHAPIADGSPWRADASYLVTGGLGGLGLAVAQRAVAGGARHLVLVSRRPLPDRALWASLPAGSEDARRTRAVLALERAGATVVTAAADVADHEALASLLGRLGDGAPPLAGVLHAALVLDSRRIAEMSPHDLLAMLRPKVGGAWALHRLTRELELDFFVLFSSTSALWGSEGLAHYAAANAFLDGLAHYRRSLGLPGLSVNWGLWEEPGPLSGTEWQRATRSGLQPMPAGEALAALDGLLGSDAAQRAVAAVDWGRLKAVYEARRARPLLEHVAPAPEQPSGASATSALRAQLDRARAHERREILLAHVQAEVAGILALGRPDAVDPRAGFFRMGMDSLTSVELKTRLEHSLGVALPASLAFNHPTVEALSGFLAAEVAPPPEDAEAVAVAAAVSAPPQAGDRSERFASLSDDDLVGLLAERLEGIG